MRLARAASIAARISGGESTDLREGNRLGFWKTDEGSDGGAVIRKLIAGFDRVDGWTAARADLIAFLVVLLGLALRFWVASRFYLNPDEAFHCSLANADSFEQLLDQALISTHPPLLIFILHVVKQVSVAELWLRVAPVVSGALAPWILYRWMAPRWGRAGGLFTLVVLSLSPMLIGLATQLRGYTLAIFLAAAALYCLELAIERGSVRWMAAFGAFLLLGIAAEYVTAWFALAAGLYFLSRWREETLTPAVRAVWVAPQLAGLSVFGWLLVAQILDVRAKMKTSEFMKVALNDFFPSPGESALSFIAEGTYGQFAYLIPSVFTVIACMMLYAAAVVFLVAGRTRRSLALAVFLVAPFVAGCVASFTRFYPYGMTRQTSLLVIFIAVGAGIAAGRVLRSRVLLAVPLAVLFVPLWHLDRYADWANIPAGRSQREKMVAAIDFYRSAIPAGALIVTDAETHRLLRFYLHPHDRVTPKVEFGTDEILADRRVFSNRWRFESLDDLDEDVRRAKDLYPEAAAGIWVLDAGWSVFLGERATAVEERFGGELVSDFGGAVYVFRMAP